MKSIKSLKSVWTSIMIAVFAICSFQALADTEDDVAKKHIESLDCWQQNPRTGDYQLVAYGNCCTKGDGTACTVNDCPPDTDPRSEFCDDK